MMTARATHDDDVGRPMMTARATHDDDVGIDR
jgi:hypothetical protein